MNRPLFGFRPNLQNERHRRAWEILQAVPEGKKTAFVAGAILRSREEEALEQTLRRVLREELRTVSIHPSAGEETVPGQMLDFLAGL